MIGYSASRIADVSMTDGRKVSPMTAMDRHVGGRVRAARMGRNLTMAGLGHAIGVSQGQVEKYERGENKMSIGRLHAIARTLSISPGWFFEDFAPDDAAAYETSPAISLVVEPTKADLEAAEIAEAIAGLTGAQRRVVRSMIVQLRAAAGDDVPMTDAAGEAAAEGDDQ